MPDAQKSTIAQLLFAKHPQFNFAKIVGELDTELDRCPSTHRSMVWDREAVAIFEIDDTCIILGLAEAGGTGFQTCLTISVGPKCSQPAPSSLTRRHDGLCRLITARLQARYPTDTVLWHVAEGPLTPDVIDDLNDALPLLADIEDIKPDRAPRFRTWSRVADNDHPLGPNPQLARVRAALYPPAEIQDRPTTQMRIAAHTFNSTLILVSLPVGAALLTYSLLRGEDFRLSARAMAITGTILTLSQTPFGQHLHAMI